jgi:hypothetical protein
MENKATAPAHTAEPWIVANHTKIVADNEQKSLIAEVFDENGQCRENARRIVACVNACEGINPETVPDLLKACRFAIFVLHQVPSTTRVVDETISSVCSLLDTVIAKAEGPALCVKCGKHPQDRENNNDWCPRCIDDLPL